jgi:hypothetical protein
MWRAHAADAWRALAAEALTEQRGRVRVLDGPGGHDAPLWPLVHVLWAAAELRAIGEEPPLDDLEAVLEHHRSGDAYRATPRERHRYFDDNAWLGLAALRLATTTGDERWRSVAGRLAAFVQTGEHPDGGVRWREGSESRNTCSTASSAWLRASVLGSGDVAAFRWVEWLGRALRRPDGLFADRIERDLVDRHAWSYNQGAVVAARTALGRADDGLVDGIVSHWNPERLWSEPPAFLVIAARALLNVPARRDVTLAWLDPYLQRLLSAARDPSTGWFTDGGLGSYDGSRTIDQAAIVQLFALRARG